VHLERTGEQRMLRESATRFLQSRGRSAQWTEFAALGWIAAALSEADGGLGGHAVDVMPICEAIGATGAAVPYFSSTLLPAGVLSYALSFAGRKELMQSFVAGHSRIAVAHTERSLIFACEEPSTLAREAPGIKLSGIKRRVWDAREADVLIVSAQQQGRFGWYLVAARQEGVRIQPGHADDEMPWATVRLENADGIAICRDAMARDALARAIVFASVGVLAESVGCMSELLRLTQDWLATRKQFGRPLAANQVLQHRLVDMFIALEESRSMLNLAAHACDHMPADEAQAAIHAPKAHIANSARFVGQQAVHLHGAMGLTEETFIGRAYRRLEAINAVFGGADHHTWAYAMQISALSP
jgi:alkylation response protein AidB-like acyl-CoA dehydrogenase